MHRFERKPSDFSNKLLSWIFGNRTQRVPFSFLHLQTFAGDLHQNGIVGLLQLVMIISGEMMMIAFIITLGEIT